VIAMSRAASVALVAAITVLCAASAGWVDTHSVEVQPTVLVIGVSAFLLAACVRDAGWMAGILVGLGVPLAHALNRAAGVTPPYPMHSYWESFVALIPAAVAAAIGVAARVTVRAVRG